MSDVSEPILDYASPMERSPLRMAVKSVIRIQSEGKGVGIYETLTGQTQALTAILFTSFTVSLLGIALLGNLRPWTISVFYSGPLIVYFLTVCGTATLVLAVIHQNWRKTTLRVSPERVILIMSTPFRGTMREWPSVDVWHVHVVQSLDQRTQRLVYDLQVMMSSGVNFKLFGGHDPPELNVIAEAVRKYLPTGGESDISK
jgi:hypothetical protein